MNGMYFGLIAAAAGASAYYWLASGDDVVLNFKEYDLPDNSITNKSSGQYAIIKTTRECDKMVKELRRLCKTYGVLGFDCQWETQCYRSKRVAMIQLSAYNGICGLFRLCNMAKMPQSLRSLLEDPAMLKVGIAPQLAARKLLEDFNVRVQGGFDLRHLAVLTQQASKVLANVSTFQNDALQMDWYAQDLKSTVEVYAATVPHKELVIFNNFVLELNAKVEGIISSNQLDRVLQKIKSKIDVTYDNHGVRDRLRDLSILLFVFLILWYFNVFSFVFSQVPRIQNY